MWEVFLKATSKKPRYLGRKIDHENFKPHLQNLSFVNDLTFRDWLGRVSTQSVPLQLKFHKAHQFALFGEADKNDDVIFLPEYKTAKLNVQKQFIHAPAFVPFEANSEQKSPFLFRASREGSSLYILGTMDANIPLDDISLKLTPIFDITEVFMTESLDAKQKSEVFLRSKYFEKFVSPSGKNLKSVLSEEAFSQLLTTLSPQFGDKGQETVSRLTLEGACLFYALTQNGAQIGSSSSRTLVAQVTDEAIRRQKPHLPLDEVDQWVVAIVELMTHECALGDLEKILLSDRTEGNYLSFEKKYTETENEKPGFFNSFIKARNRNWIPILLDSNRKYKNSFAAFGVTHLVGSEGILNLLKEEGFLIERLEQE